MRSDCCSRPWRRLVHSAAAGRASQRFDVRILSSAQPGFETRGLEPFRLDLLSNLNVLTLRIPPLRDYAEDVPELLRYYVDRLVDDERLPFRRFGVAAQNRLRNYPWPGNIRELKNLVHRLLIQGGPEEIRLEEIEREISSQTPVDEPLVKQDLLALPLREAREHFERAYLTQQLQLCGGKVGPAREARRHGAHAPLSQAALARRGFPPVGRLTRATAAARPGSRASRLLRRCAIAAASRLPLVIRFDTRPCQTSALRALSIACTTSVPSLKLRMLGVPTLTEPPTLPPQLPTPTPTRTGLFSILSALAVS